MVLGDIFPDVSNPNMILYEFITLHLNFIQKEHVKFNETCLNVQGRLKTYLSNTLDVLGHLTSKLHENLTTSYKCYINSFKDLIFSLITHKHTKQLMRHIGDSIIERLGRPLTFDFQCT